jgi:hypothetical protein
LNAVHHARSKDGPAVSFKARQRPRLDNGISGAHLSECSSHHKAVTVLQQRSNYPIRPHAWSKWRKTGAIPDCEPSGRRSLISLLDHREGAAHDKRLAVRCKGEYRAVKAGTVRSKCTPSAPIVARDAAGGYAANRAENTASKQFTEVLVEFEYGAVRATTRRGTKGGPATAVQLGHVIDDFLGRTTRPSKLPADEVARAGCGECADL